MWCWTQIPEPFWDGIIRETYSHQTSLLSQASHHFVSCIFSSFLLFLSNSIPFNSLSGRIKRPDFVVQQKRSRKGSTFRDDDDETKSLSLSLVSQPADYLRKCLGKKMPESTGKASPFTHAVREWIFSVPDVWLLVALHPLMMQKAKQQKLFIPQRRKHTHTSLTHQNKPSGDRFPSWLSLLSSHTLLMHTMGSRYHVYQKSEKRMSRWSFFLSRFPALTLCP